MCVNTMYDEYSLYNIYIYIFFIYLFIYLFIYIFIYLYIYLFKNIYIYTCCKGFKKAVNGSFSG